MVDSVYSDRLAIISGATGGIGREVAKQMVEENLASKYMLLYRNEEKFKTLFHKVVMEHKEIISVKYDMGRDDILPLPGDAASIGINTVTLILTAFDVRPISMMRDLSVSDIRTNITSNVIGQIILIKDVYSWCESSGLLLDIVSMNSGAAYNYIRGWSLYSAGKTCVNCFLDHLRQEENVRVVLYSPGTVQTDMQEEIISSDGMDIAHHREFVEKLESGNFRDPEAVAKDIIDRYVRDWTAKDFTESVSNIEMRMKYKHKFPLNR